MPSSWQHHPSPATLWTAGVQASSAWSDVPMTRRLTEALRRRGIFADRVCCAMGRASRSRRKWFRCWFGEPPRRANVRPGIHILRHTLFSHLAMRGAPARAIQEWPGTRTWARRSATCTEPGRARRGDPVVGDGHRNEPRSRGEMVEAAGVEPIQSRWKRD